MFLIRPAGLLLFPLRGGAMALAALIALYSLAGGICLFVWGEFLWFGPYEYQVREPFLLT